MQHSDSVNQFRLTVYVEDQVSQKGPFQIIVHAPWRLKLSQLKQRAQTLWNIPVSLQHWILNGSVARNEEATLSELCSGSSAAIAFLCIVAATATATSSDGTVSRRHSTAESVSSTASSGRKQKKKNKVARSATCVLPNISGTASTQQRQLAMSNLVIKINQALTELDSLKRPTELACIVERGNEKAANCIPEIPKDGSPRTSAQAQHSFATAITNLKAKGTEEDKIAQVEDKVENEMVDKLELEEIAEAVTREGVSEGGAAAELPPIDLPEEISVEAETSKRRTVELGDIISSQVDLQLDRAEQETVVVFKEKPEEEAEAQGPVVDIVEVEHVKVEVSESITKSESHANEKDVLEKLDQEATVPAPIGQIEDETEERTRDEDERKIDSSIAKAQVDFAAVEVEGRSSAPVAVTPLEVCQETQVAEIETEVQVPREGDEAGLGEATTTENSEIAIAGEELYKNLLSIAENVGAIRNQEEFECKVCFLETKVGQGIVLKNCLHMFCRSCIEDVVKFSTEAQIHCPYIDENYSCPSYIQEKEIKDLVPNELYEKYLARSMKLAELTSADAFHCKTPDCKGWCIIEGNVRIFTCPICSTDNCIHCKAIHPEESCQEFSERQEKEFAERNLQEATSVKFLKDMIKRGEALDCPNCHVVLLRKWGCDWLRCSYCKTEICWVTKGFRWGPNGKGDTSGGCRCGVNGVKCHPKCTYCH